MYEVVCPICRKVHRVRQSNFKYCPAHTERERAAYAASRYRMTAKYFISKRAERRRKRARERGHEGVVERHGPHYPSALAIPYQDRLKPPCQGCPVWASCRTGWVDPTACSTFLERAKPELYWQHVAAGNIPRPVEVDE